MLCGDGAQHARRINRVVHARSAELPWGSIRVVVSQDRGLRLIRVDLPDRRRRAGLFPVIGLVLLLRRLAYIVGS